MRSAAVIFAACALALGVQNAAAQNQKQKGNPPAASAREVVIPSVTPDTFASILQDIGYRAEILKNDEGRRRIRTRIGGWNVTVSFYSCDDKENCKSLGLRSFFENDKKRDAAWANDWNNRKRFAKVYIDRDNDVNIECDIMLREGITKGNIRAYLDIYEDQLKDFVEELRK